MAKIDERKVVGSVENMSLAPFLASSSIEPFIQAGSRFLDAWIKLSNEVLEFSKGRLDQNVQFSRAITQTSSLDEAIDLQTRHTRAAMQDYLSEANKIVDLSTRSLLDSLAPLRHAPEAVANRVESATHQHAAE